MNGSDTRRAARRRRLALAAVATAALVGGAIAGASDTQRVSLQPQAPTRAQLDRALGQRIITAMDGVGPDAYLLRLARRGRIGGVILFARNIRTVKQVRQGIDRLQRAAKAGGNPPLLITVDQEGGPVKRFQSLPPTTSPRRMSTRAAASQGRATGKALRQAGVNVDLAPVADVTSNPASFLYERSHTSAAATCAFAKGLAASKVKPTLKHFPGLGGAPANTDDASVTLRTSRATLKRRAKAYRTCGNQGLVMVNSARYATFGSEQALFEPSIYRFLRGLHVTAPTISDSIQAAALAGEKHIPTRAIKAGLDLVLSTGSQRTAEEIYLGLAGASRAGTLRAGTIMAGARRIARLKAQLT